MARPPSRRPNSIHRELRQSEPTSARSFPGLFPGAEKSFDENCGQIRPAQQLAAGGQFSTLDPYALALDALGGTDAEYSLASSRYDLSKLRAKRLGERIPHSRRYRLAGRGYSICVAFLKLFENMYAPLTAGLLAPFRGDRMLPEEKRCTPDRLYQRVSGDLKDLLRAVGLRVAA